MKKRLMFLAYVLLFLPQLVGATELGDANLYIDSSRIEQEAELKLGSQDQPLQFLFRAKEQEDLMMGKETERSLLQAQQASLFQVGEKPSTDILQVGTLFTSNSHKNRTTKVDGISNGSPTGLLSGFLFTMLVVGILTVASLATYLVSKKEIEDPY